MPPFTLSPVTFILWFLLVWGAGWCFFPIARRVLGDFPDGGLAIGRVLFLTLWTMIAFWAGYAGVAVSLSAWLWLPFAFIGLVFWGRDRAALRTEIRARRRAIWTAEAIFLGAFLLFFGLRGFWSDTSGTNGEKSMDNALISSLARAQRLPPPNPFAAGARLNSYYYFGHLQSALLTDSVRSHPRWTYNLTCATLPALCFSTLFSVGAALTKRIDGGVFCTASVLGLGTLQPIYQWLYPLEFAADTPFRLKFFEVSRVIPFTINEFPFFTFNQADLHAHYFDLPLSLTTIGLAYALFCGRKAAIWPAMMLLGAQIMTNTWDFPAYALVVGLALWNGAQNPTRRTRATLAEEEQAEAPLKIAFWPALLRIKRPLFVWCGALVLAAPYLLHLKTAASPPKFLQFPASPLREWLLLWGVFAAAWLAFLAYSVPVSDSDSNSNFDSNLAADSNFDGRSYRAFCLGLGVIFLVYALAVPWKRPDPFVLPLIFILLGFSVWSARRLQGEARFLCFLAIAGLCALAWSETTWTGFLGNAAHAGFDDNKRQDTVFKFGLQTWILWGVAASCGAVWTRRKWPFALQMAWMPVLSILTIASVAVMFGRARNFKGWDGWDGWAHLAPSEKRAAEWLVQNLKPSENLVEAEQKEGGDYSPYARYSCATGIPAVVGPQAHTFQWSPANSGDASQEWAEVFRRKAAAHEIYVTKNSEVRASWLRTFGVKALIFGELEREQYGLGALENLRSDPNLKEVARFEDTPVENTPVEDVGLDSSDSLAGYFAGLHRVQIFRVK